MNGGHVESRLALVVRGVNVGSMLHHDIQKLSIDGAAASSTARAAASACTQNPTRKTGGIQPWRNPHAIDVRIRTVVQQQHANVEQVKLGGYVQRRQAVDVPSVDGDTLREDVDVSCRDSSTLAPRTLTPLSKSFTAL